MPIAALTAGISAAATIGTGAIQAGAANKASQTAATANANDLAFTKGVYGTATSNLQPTIQQGQQAGSALAGLLGIGGNPGAAEAAFKNYLGSTNYQFQLGQGENAIEYANAPEFNSSATAKALNNYAQGQAGTALQGYESLLSGQQGLGASAAGALGGIGTGTGGLINQTNLTTAANQGTAALTGGAANANALTGLAALINQRATQSSFGPSAFPNAGGGVITDNNTPSYVGGI